MNNFPLDEVRWTNCNICGKDMPVNVNYPVLPVTCIRCHLEKKWQSAEKDANLDEPSY